MMKPRFLKSAAHPEDFPPDNGSELAIVGRSNSGKSSALNVLCGSTKLARVSKTPGRTQLINFFQLAENRRIVDLPGYGYARVAADIREQWRQMVSGYLDSRRCLVALIVTLDIRRGVTELDHRMLAWAQSLELETLILATKADKLSRGAAKSQLLQIRREAPNAWVQAFSALDKQGLEPARERLRNWLETSRQGAEPNN